MPDIPLSLPAETAAPLPPKPLVHRIFMGPEGLRAGWSLLIFLLLLAAALRGVTVVVKLLHWLPPRDPHADIPLITSAGEGLAFIGVFLATWIMSKIEPRPNSAYGLGSIRAVPNFFLGAFWGFVFLSVLVLMLRLSGLLVFDQRVVFGFDVLRYGFLWFLGFLTVGFLEEYLTRGYLLFTGARGLGGLLSRIFKTPRGKAIGFWITAILLCALFGFGHKSNPGESPIGLISAGLAGLVWCYALWRTGTLWWAIGFHAAWDWSQSFLYGVADSGLFTEHRLMLTHPVGAPLFSGGTTGPEGSIYILPLLALMVVIIRFTLPRTPHPMAK